MSTTRDLVSFAIAKNFGDIPREVVERAKELVLDAVGATLLGSTTPAGKIVTEYVKQATCRQEASVIGAGFRTWLPQAAFLNCSLLHSTELEADPMAGTGLPAPSILASLSTGEKCRASGKEALTAIILGYEVQGRIQAASPGIARRGFVASPLVCCLGAAAAASKLLGLNVDQFSMVLGVAAPRGGGLAAQAGTMAHFLELAWAVGDGVDSALLAQAGITAMPDVIENPEGFCHVFAGEGGYDLEEMSKDLGNPFLLISPGINIKKYPCCFRNHRALDAVFQLIKEHRISYEDVASVEVGVNKWDVGLLKFTEPTTGLEAKFSLNHSLAAAILKGKPDWQSWTDESAADPKFKEARSKVKVVYHPEWPPDRSQSRVPVSITLRDGRTYTKEVHEPINLSHEEIISRYKRCVEPVLPTHAIDHSIELILNLEKLDDVSELLDVVRGREQV